MKVDLKHWLSEVITASSLCVNSTEQSELRSKHKTLLEEIQRLSGLQAKAETANRSALRDIKSEVNLMLSELNKNIATVLDEVIQLSEKFDGIASSLVSLVSSAVTNKEQLQDVGKLLQEIQNIAKAARDTIISAVLDSASSSAVAQQQALTAAVETMHLQVKNIFEESSTEVSSIV